MVVYRSPIPGAESREGTLFTGQEQEKPSPTTGFRGTPVTGERPVISNGLRDLGSSNNDYI